MNYQVNLNSQLNFNSQLEANDLFNCLISFYYHNLSVVQLAIKHHGDPLSSNPYGCALELAVKEGQVEVVKYLLSTICPVKLSVEYVNQLIQLAREAHQSETTGVIEHFRDGCQSTSTPLLTADDLAAGQKLKNLLLDIELEQHQPSCYFKHIHN